MAARCNLLLLDEPIHPLDIPSRERFEPGLAQFEGTGVAVRHDRTFIARLAPEVRSVEEGTLRRYVGLRGARSAR